MEFLPSFQPNKSRYMKFMDIGILLISLFFIFCDVLFTLFFIAYPTLPHLFGSLLPSDKLFLLPILHLYHVYSNTILLTQIYLNVTVMFIYGCVYLPIVIPELRLGRSKYRTSNALRKPDTLIWVYRMVQIIQEVVNQLVGRLLVPSQALFTLEFIFGCYTIIRHTRDLLLIAVLTISIWSIVPSLLWAGFLYSGGYLNSSGRKILNSWKYHHWPNKQVKQSMSKFVRSCRPLALCYGTIFVIRRQTLLIFLRGLIRGLMRALLTTKTTT